MDPLAEGDGTVGDVAADGLGGAEVPLDEGGAPAASRAHVEHPATGERDLGRHRLVKRGAVAFGGLVLSKRGALVAGEIAVVHEPQIGVIAELPGDELVENPRPRAVKYLALAKREGRQSRSSHCPFLHNGPYLRGIKPFRQRILWFGRRSRRAVPLSPRKPAVAGDGRSAA